MNTNTDTMTGIPNPPLRMMVPSGAPMKKKIRHDNDSTNFLYISILCCLIMRLASSVTIALNSMSALTACTCERAMPNTLLFPSLFSRAKALSTLKAFLPASFMAAKVSARLMLAAL